MRYLCKTLFIFILFFMHGQGGHGQVNRQMSIEDLHGLLNSVEDTVKLEACKALVLKYTLDDIYQDSALLYSNKLVDLAKVIGDQKSLEDSYFVRGYVNTKFNNINEAIDNYDSSISILRTLGDSADLSARLLNLASCYYYIEQMEKAMEFFSAALEISLKIDDKMTAARIHNNIGLIFGFTGNHKKSIENFNKSLALKKELNDTLQLYSAYMNLADAYALLEDYNNAILNLKKAQMCLNNLEQKLTWRMGYAEILYKKGDLIQAQTVYQSVLDSIRLIGRYHEFEARANLGLAKIYLDIDKPDLSIHHGSKALVYFENNDIISDQRDILKILSACHYKLYQFKESKKLMDRVLILNDSIHSKKMNEQLQRLQVKYDFEQKDYALKLLQIENELKEERIVNQSKASKYLLLGLFSVLIIALLLYSQNRLRRKSTDEMRIKQDLISFQKNQIEKEKNRTLESIHSALDVQKVILTTEEELANKFSDVFIIYYPKDIISGDFYWTFDAGYADIVALVDCTGHGVPGALTSMLGFNLLERVIKEYGVIQPNFILNILSREMARMLANRNEPQKVHFGMEISICAISKKRDKIHLASTNTPIYIINKHGLNEFKSDPLTLGKMDFKNGESYSHHESKLEPGDMVYMFTDGYIDQMGGPNRRKFYYQPFRDLLMGNIMKPCEAQKGVLEESFKKWKGTHEQTDDISVLGIRI
ncbi:MAG: tetratricopeptide repeat protein [Flavobacteriales bacterium]|nr:tetratricopeptide repeat protein [Flavobacteriales bacterium]